LSTAVCIFFQVLKLIPRAVSTRRRAKWSFPRGAILVFDRGYNDYAWFERLTAGGVFFVTRMKDNADYLVVEDRSLPQRTGPSTAMIPHIRPSASGLAGYRAVVRIGLLQQTIYCEDLRLCSDLSQNVTVSRSAGRCAPLL
jgi:hypothetical protein